MTVAFNLKDQLHKIGKLKRLVKGFRRIVGDVLLTGKDVSSGKTWPDACVPCTWSMDLHLPNKAYLKGFEGDAFISRAQRETSPWMLCSRVSR